MASIDAFLDFAAREPAPERAVRASLRRLRPSAAMPAIRGIQWERSLILAAVVVLHVLLFLGLRALMRPDTATHDAALAPFQIIFIDRRDAPLQPAMRIQRSIPHSSPMPRQSALHVDALQAVTIAPRAAVTEHAQPDHVSLYGPDGALLAPDVPTRSPPRDLMVHRSVSWMLPGGGRVHSPDFHVRQGTSPQDVVNTAGRVIGALMGNAANATRSDINGITPTAADRGLRTSDRDSDPCEDIELNMVNLEDADARKEAEERYEQSCEGR